MKPSISTATSRGLVRLYVAVLGGTKARFIQQVMNGSVTVRQAKTSKAARSPMPKSRPSRRAIPRDGESEGLILKSASWTSSAPPTINQQHKIRWQVKNLPDDIRRSKETAERMAADIATRDTHTGEDLR